MFSLRKCIQIETVKLSQNLAIEIQYFTFYDILLQMPVGRFVKSVIHHSECTTSLFGLLSLSLR